jgi:hypothetical protein
MNSKQHFNQILAVTTGNFLRKHFVPVFEMRPQIQVFRELSAIRLPENLEST